MTGWHAGSLKGHVLTHPLVEKCVKSTGSSFQALTGMQLSRENMETFNVKQQLE